MDAGVPLGTIQRWLGHSNILQTSTYLAGTAASEHDAMRQYEAHRESLCNGCATDDETGGRKSPAAAEEHEETLNNTAGDREPTIM